jgi:hypothetical protein
MSDPQPTGHRMAIDLALRRSQYVLLLASQIAWTTVEAAAVFLWQWVRWLRRQEQAPR